MKYYNIDDNIGDDYDDYVDYDDFSASLLECVRLENIVPSGTAVKYSQSSERSKKIEI